MSINKLISAFLFVLIYTFSTGQQSSTLYFMLDNPQANIFNPAVKHKCKFNMSGILIPLAGQLPPPLHINLTSTGFSYKDIIFKGSGIYSDSLIHFMHPAADPDDFFRTLKKRNDLFFETHINLLSAGINIKDWYFTVGVTEKFDFRFSFSRDFLKALYHLNGHPDYLGGTIDLSGTSINSSYYREYAIGASKDINKKLTVGAKVKLLYGKANFTTKKSDITWHTSIVNAFAYRIKSDVRFNISQPFYEISEFHFDEQANSFVSTIIDINPSPADILLNRKNFGLGLDLGAVYRDTDNITLFASLIDLGYIKWKHNPTQIIEKGDLNFDGINLIGVLRGEDTFENAITNLGDSLVSSIDIKSTRNEYTNFLYSKFFIGGTYRLNEKLNAGALFRGEFYQKELHSSLTLSANAQLTKWFGASLSYSVMHNGLMNVGLGFQIKGGPLQLYMVSDNILAPIFLNTTKFVNARMGMNLVFGCK